MGMYSKEYADRVVEDCKGMIHTARTKIRKNFDDMDFENVVQKVKIEEYIQDMEDECTILIGRLDCYRFE